MTFRTIELRDANGDLVCEEPIKQPEADELFAYATFGGRAFRLNSAEARPPRAEYYEIPALRCGRAVIHDGQMSAWRDGVPDGPDFVLACVESDRGRRAVIRASYARQYELVSSPESIDEHCDYHEEQDEYFVPEGWYESNEFEEINWRVEGEVIGWMPLPSPPAKIEGVEVERIVEAAVGGSNAT
jgi:hypothetical protein